LRIIACPQFKDSKKKIGRGDSKKGLGSPRKKPERGSETEKSFAFLQKPRKRKDKKRLKGREHQKGKKKIKGERSA